MPCYDFVCTSACDNRVEDAIYPAASVPDSIPCEQCGGVMLRVLAYSPAVHTDTPKWIDKHLNAHVGNKGGPPIETRSQLEAFARKKNLSQIN